MERDGKRPIGGAGFSIDRNYGILLALSSILGELTWMKKPTLLVVDEDPFFRRLYEDTLAEEGYLVEAVATGEAAANRLRQGAVDLLVADLAMTDVDLLSQACQMYTPPEILVTAGPANIPAAVQALNCGAKDYLVKPFEPDELKHRVRNCLATRQLQEENLLLKAQVRLHEGGQVLTTELDLDTLLQHASEAMVQEAGEGRSFAFLLNKNKPPRLLGIQGGDPEPAVQALIRDLRAEIESAENLNLLQREKLQATEDWPEDLRTLCLLPLRFAGELRGALFLYNPAGSDLADPLPMENLRFLADQVDQGFQNACRFQGTQDLIFIDDLTKLYNYRYLQIILDQEVRRSERYLLELSLIFIDLDYFKSVNDSRGHLAGSAVLKELGALLQSCVREVDLVFRYGGDEFTALLVETGAKGASLVGERIRATIEGHAFLAETDQPLKLTATVGYAVYPGDAINKQTLVDLADRAMYDGKKSRNTTRGASEI